MKMEYSTYQLLQKYDYQITNSVLRLGNNYRPLRGEIEIPVVQSIYHQLTKVCSINLGNQTIKSEVEINNNIDKIRKLNTKIRLDHVYREYKKTIQENNHKLQRYITYLFLNKIHYHTTHLHNIRSNSLT